MTLVCGLLGMPPVNGVLPQSPMHTKALTKVAGRRAAMKQRDTGQQEQEQQQGSAAAANGPFRPAGRSNGALLPDQAASRHIHPSPTALPLLPLNGTATSKVAAPAAKDGNSLPPSPAVGDSSEWPPPALMPEAAAEAAGAGAGAECDIDGGDEVVPVHVYEQRVSGLLQSLGVGACLAAMPAIRQIPTAALWGELRTRVFVCVCVERAGWWQHCDAWVCSPARLSKTRASACAPLRYLISNLPPARRLHVHYTREHSMPFHAPAAHTPTHQATLLSWRWRACPATSCGTEPCCWPQTLTVARPCWSRGTRRI